MVEYSASEKHKDDLDNPEDQDGPANSRNWVDICGRLLISEQQIAEGSRNSSEECPGDKSTGMRPGNS